MKNLEKMFNRVIPCPSDPRAAYIATGISLDSTESCCEIGNGRSWVIYIYDHDNTIL